MRTYMEDWAAEIQRVNEDNGWFDTERPYGAGIALIHSEASEALEAYRDHGMKDMTLKLCPEHSGRVYTDENTWKGHVCKPEGSGRSWRMW